MYRCPCILKLEILRRLSTFTTFSFQLFVSFRLVSLFSFVISLPNKLNCFVLRVDGKHVTLTDTQLLLCNVYSQYRHHSWFYVLCHTVGSISSDKHSFGERQPERQSTIFRQESFRSIKLTPSNPSEPKAPIPDKWGHRNQIWLQRFVYSDHERESTDNQLVPVPLDSETTSVKPEDLGAFSDSPPTSFGLLQHRVMLYDF